MEFEENDKKIEEFRESDNEALSQYHEGSKFIKQHKDIFIKSLIFVFLQIAANYAIVYFVYRSFGLNEVGFAKMIFIQALLCVSTTSIPLPGTVGISESAFLTIYLTIFTEASLVSGMLLSRGISFYLFMLISLIVVLLNMMFIKKKN